MTLKDAIECEARQGKLINHARWRGEGDRRGCLSGRIVFKRCNLVLILADGKTARREPTTLQFQGDARERPTDRPTCRSAVGISVPRGMSCRQPVHSLFAYKAAHVHVHARARAHVATSDERDNCERDGKLLSRNRLFSAHRV